MQNVGVWMALSILCDMIKGKESDVINIDSDLQTKWGDKFKWFTLFTGPFVLHRNCVAVPIYRLLSATGHRSFTAFQVKMNITFMQHSNAVTLQFLCRRVQRGNATQLRCSMNGPYGGTAPKPKLSMFCVLYFKTINPSLKNNVKTWK